MNREIWRLVPGYSDVFASSLGRVRRLHPQTKKWLIGRGIPYNEGYLRMHFHGKRWLVHRLIATAFIPNRWWSLGTKHPCELPKPKLSQRDLEKTVKKIEGAQDAIDI